MVPSGLTDPMAPDLTMSTDEIEAVRRAGPSRRSRATNRILRLGAPLLLPHRFDAATLTRSRRRFELIGHLSPPVAGMATSFGELAGRPARWDRPTADSDEHGVILYLHGGAYIMGSPTSGAELAQGMALATGRTVIGLDYRMATEDRFPAWVDDAEAAFSALAETHGAERVMVAGDSAGGGLTLALLLRLKSVGAPQPAAAMAFSPWTDILGRGDSARINDGSDPTLSPYWLRSVGATIVVDSGADPDDPELSPALGDYSGCAPVLLQVGDIEILLDDARSIRDAYERAGIDHTYSEWPGAGHVFTAQWRLMPEARAALAEVGRFVRRHSH